MAAPTNTEFLKASEPETTVSVKKEGNGLAFKADANGNRAEETGNEDSKSEEENTDSEEDESESSVESYYSDSEENEEDGHPQWQGAQPRAATKPTVSGPKHPESQRPNKPDPNKPKPSSSKPSNNGGGKYGPVTGHK